MPAWGTTIELLLGGAWTDITADVYLRDLIKIGRGRPNQGGRVDPGSCTLTINNKSGKYGPRNAMSPLYGLIGRNTQVRVSTTAGVRFVGEIRAWPSKWDISGGDVYVQVQAAGIKQRLDRRTAPLDSALRRAVTTAAPLRYWPIEDGQQATQAASGLVGGAPLRTTGGAPQFGATDGPAGSLPLPDFSNGGALHGVVTGASAASHTVECVVKFPTSLPAGFAAAVSWTVTGSRANIWEIDAQPVGSGGLSVQWANTAFSDFGGPYYSNVAVADGLWHHVRATIAQSGTAISVQMWLDGVRVVNTSEPTVTLGVITSVDVNGGAAANAGVPSLGHLAVWSPSTTAPTYLAVNGYDGDAAADRISRLCGEQAVPLTLPYGSDTLPVGPQTTDTFLNLLESAGDVDMGILYEDRVSVALAYRTRSSLYNQTPRLTLDYNRRGEVAPPLEPTEDDTAVVNDITVSRPNGSSAQAVLGAGALSTQAPPAGVGAYPVSTTLAAHSDDQLADLAGWLLYLGTWDEARFPQVTVNLAAGPWLATAAAAVDLGDVITIINPPAWLPPDDIDLMVQGYSETIGVFDWTITYNCVPAGPWTVGVLDDPVLGRLDTDGSSLAVGVAAGDATLSVNVTAGPLWVTTALNPAEFPFDIRVAGEVMTVGGISGTSSPQTFSPVIRAVNGVAKPQAAGTDVRLAQPLILAL